MNCNIIRDLLPLYIDNCCSEESEKEVRAHLECCTECRSIYESMASAEVLPAAVPEIPKMNRVNEWRASILQSALFFVLFGIITVGVALEARSPYGSANGMCAFIFIVPATGFLVSLANWFFLRQYRSKKAFSAASLALTLTSTAVLFVWALLHYEAGDRDILSIISSSFGLTAFLSLTLTAVSCVLSKMLSEKYASLLGKE